MKKILPLLVVLVCFWSVAFYALDFGVQADEVRSKFDSVKRSIDTGVFRQSVDEPDGHGYTYGGVNYLLTWVGLTPEVASVIIKGPRTREGLAHAIDPVLFSTAVRLRVRAIYVLLSSLAIVWVYFIAMLSGRSQLEALFAAAILALSWEVGYHSRYVAPDVVMMQFAALAFFCLARKWRYLGAVAVGLAAGTKYPGGLVLPFFLVGAGYLAWKEGKSPRSIGLGALAFAGVAGLTFVVTTPGVLVDSTHFFGMLRQLKDIYSGEFYGYGVTPGLPHLWAMLQYFGVEGFSHYWFLSLVLAAFCVFGFVLILRERKPVELLFACFCAAYIGYFSFQSTMFVRNLMVVFPFLALACARGVMALSSKRSAVCVAVAAILMVNLGWNVYAAHQVTKRTDAEYFLKKFDNYVRQSPETFLISGQLFADLKKFKLGQSGNIVRDANASFSKVAFLQTEGPDRLWARWPSNRRDLYEKTFGALDVNLGAYTSMIGNERILVVSKGKLAALPLVLADVARDPVQPTLTLDKSEVIAGKDSYTTTVPSMAGANVLFRYSIDGGAAREFTATLNPSGEIRFDVSADVPKGLYRFFAFRLAYGWDWHDSNATLLVK